ncbi:IS3 family transposase [Deinococcus aquatilis]|uniref:IS3 family transposase n=1 Tax=Deinococcus aquatilis TaxID=519440 RepID=UPI000361CBCD|nr:IS3 family transposase [Deinococcus aquatilis]
MVRDLVTQRVKPVRACFLVGLPQSSWHDRAKPRQDDELRGRIRKRSEQHPRRGYRFIHALLVKEGSHINRKRVRRIWREEQLTIKKKPIRKIRTGNTIPMTAECPNHVWTYDFILDQTLGGTTLKILTLTDEFTRQSLAIRVAEAFTSMDVKAVLDEVIKERGAPNFLRSDNGSEFIARDLGIWLAVQEVTIRFIEPGKPWQNGFAESFHFRLREECLSQEVLYSAKHAGVLIEGWRAFYNTHRPHSSLAYQTPDAFSATWLAQSVSHPVPCG